MTNNKVETENENNCTVSDKAFGQVGVSCSAAPVFLSLDRAVFHPGCWCGSLAEFAQIQRCRCVWSTSSSVLTHGPSRDFVLIYDFEARFAIHTLSGQTREVNGSFLNLEAPLCLRAMATLWSKLPSGIAPPGLTLFCVLLFCSTAAGTRESGDVFSSVRSPAGGRNLLQIVNACPHQFAFDNFTNLEQACPPANVNSTTYPKTACCAALAAMLCPWKDQINDPNSDCAHSFWSTLPLATNGTLDQPFFMYICTDPNQPNGVPCPDTPAPAPNLSSPRLVWEVLPIAILIMSTNFLLSWV